MFGYIQPDKGELKMREYQLYKSVYCGLCRHLGKDYGILARLTLSYDCTVFAMLSMSLKNEKCTVTNGRCTCNPFKKCLMCDSTEGESFAFAGAVSVIMSYYKLCDTINDSGFLKRTAAGFLRLLLKRNYQKAAKRFPNIDWSVEEMMERQLAAEKENVGIDRAAEPTAQLVSKLCEMLSSSRSEKRVLGVFGYYVGRWIYLMDAADDLEDDVKHKCFNPFRSKLSNDIKETMTYCNEVLNMTDAQLIMAYELLPISSYKDVLDNIIYKGIPKQQEYCLFEKKNENRRKKKEKNYFDYLNHQEWQK